MPRVLRIDVEDERQSRPRPNHIHLDVLDERHALEIIEGYVRIYGHDLTWVVVEYISIWRCLECGQNRHHYE